MKFLQTRPGSDTKGPPVTDNRYSINEFVQQTAQQDLGQGLFELESERILEVNLNGQVWTKTGSMIAYRGGITSTEQRPSRTISVVTLPRIHRSSRSCRRLPTAMRSARFSAANVSSALAAGPSTTVQSTNTSGGASSSRMRSSKAAFTPSR